MADSKKKGALVAMFGPKDEPDEDDAADGEDGADDYDADDGPFIQACDEAMEAVKKGDKEAFCEALKSAIDIRVSGGAPVGGAGPMGGMGGGEAA